MFFFLMLSWCIPIAKIAAVVSSKLREFRQAWNWCSRSRPSKLKLPKLTRAKRRRQSRRHPAILATVASTGIHGVTMDLWWWWKEQFNVYIIICIIYVWFLCCKCGSITKVVCYGYSSFCCNSPCTICCSTFWTWDITMRYDHRLPPLNTRAAYCSCLSLPGARRSSFRRAALSDASCTAVAIDLVQKAAWPMAACGSVRKGSGLVAAPAQNAPVWAKVLSVETWTGE